MELRIEEFETPSKIGWNFEELKTEISAKVQQYEMLVYSEAQMQEAKKDRAALNKLKTALNDERIKQEKEYMQSFREFKSQVNELIKIIDKPITAIDSQLQVIEEKRLAEKQLEIEKLYQEADFPEWVEAEKVIDEKWKNASVNASTIKSALQERKQKIADDISTLEKLPELAFEAAEIYKESLDLNETIKKTNWLSKIQEKRKERQERLEKVKETAETEKQWLSFSALLSIDDAQALKELFLTRNIQFKQI